jgi:hypothetical protein
MTITVDYPCPALDFAAAELRRAFAGRFVGDVAISARNFGLPEQGYSVSVDGGTLVIAGADTAGAMYGALDAARGFAGDGGIRIGAVSPHILRRGVKFNIPLDARTPSYSDSGDSAQENIANVWDFSFWQGFLDRMARNMFNVLSLWNLSPFPSMVNIPEYPETALPDVKRAGHVPRGSLRGTGLYSSEQEKTLVVLKKMTIEEKIGFWRKVMQYADDRCISVYLFTWNAYVYGTQYGNYGITDDPANPITKDYVRRAAEALVRTYPLLRGVGVTAGENMRPEWKTDVREDVEWIRDTYGKGVENALKDDPNRRFTLILRSHMTGAEQIEAVFSDYPHTFEMSCKYSMAHLYSVTKPRFIDGFFKSLARKTWLTLRSDDCYLLRWGDCDFVREYLSALPLSAIAGFYLGPDGIVWGKDYAPRDPQERGAYFFDRHWFSFALWGQLAYDIRRPESYFQALWEPEFGNQGYAVYEALKQASKAIPIQQRVYWHDFDFQWYPEASASYLAGEDALIFHTLDDFVRGASCPGSGYLSVGEYCDCLHCNKTPHGITPLEASGEIETACLRALDILQAVRRTPLTEDIEAMSRLGLYYAYKFRAAVSLRLYRQALREPDRQSAVAWAERSAEAWIAYSGSIARRYRPQRLGRLRNPISPDMFDDYARFDAVIAADVLNIKMQC